MFSTAAIAFASSGGKKIEKPAPGQTVLDKVKEAVPINAGSRYFLSLFLQDAALIVTGHAAKRRNCMCLILLLCVRSGCRRLTRMNSIKNYIAEAEKEAKH